MITIFELGFHGLVLTPVAVVPPSCSDSHKTRIDGAHRMSQRLLRRLVIWLAYYRGTGCNHCQSPNCYRLQTFRAHHAAFGSRPVPEWSPAALRELAPQLEVVRATCPRTAVPSLALAVLV